MDEVLEKPDTAAKREEAQHDFDTLLLGLPPVSINGRNAIQLTRSAMRWRLDDLGITDPAACRELMCNASYALELALSRLSTNDEMTPADCRIRLEEISTEAKERKYRELNLCVPETEAITEFPAGSGAHYQQAYVANYYEGNERQKATYAGESFRITDTAHITTHSLHDALTADLAQTGCQAALQGLDLSDAPAMPQQPEQWAGTRVPPTRPGSKRRPPSGPRP